MSLKTPNSNSLCTICRHGETAPGVVTVTLQRGDTTVVLEGVPADVCDNCGEYYLDEVGATQVYAMAETAARNGAEVEA